MKKGLSFIENEHLFNFVLSAMYFNEAKREREIFELWRKGYNNCDIAKQVGYTEGTLLDKRDFVLNYLDRTYQRVYGIKGSVGYVSSLFPNNDILITMRGHIVCSKNGVIYDTFDCRDRKVESVWLVN